MLFIGRFNAVSIGRFDGVHLEVVFILGRCHCLV